MHLLPGVPIPFSLQLRALRPYMKLPQSRAAINKDQLSIAVSVGRGLRTAPVPQRLENRAAKKSSHDETLAAGYVDPALHFIFNFTFTSTPSEFH